MRTTYLSLTLLIFATLLMSCGNEGGDGAGTDPAADTTATSASNTDAEAAAVETQAICLWGKVGLRSGPGMKDVKYMTTIYFGEKLTPTGKEELIEDEERTYVEVSLSDGKVGWVNNYLLANPGELAAVTSTLQLYKRPDLATLKGSTFETGEVLALGAEKDGWREVFGYEKKKEGWIQADAGVTTDEKDVTVAVLYQRAIKEENSSKKKEQLSAIAANKALAVSNFMSLVNEALAEPEEVAPEIGENQLLVNADRVNVRSEAKVEEGNVLFQLDKNTVVDILETGAEETIRDMTANWYKISHEGQQGWIYGYHTSKKE